MLEIAPLIDIVRRLRAGLEIVKLSQTVFPRLVADGRTTAEIVDAFLAQLPALQADIEKQIQSAKAAMDAIQDRVEALAQLLLLHRAALSPSESEQLTKSLAQLRN